MNEENKSETDEKLKSTKKPVSIATPPSGAPFIGKTGIGTKKNDTGNY